MNWFSEEILSMLSYVLVVSRGFTVLIFICPMLNGGKLNIIASCAIIAILKITWKV